MRKLGLALLFLSAVPCFAQQGATAELTGRVTAAGQALPGVTVTLNGEALQGKHVTITGENGGYLFPLLPPADYLLRFDLKGFTAVEKRASVSLATTTRVDVELGLEPVREIVTVERAPIATGTSVGTNLRASELQRLPGGRDIRAAVLLSPGTNAPGSRNRLAIAGAPSWESLYLIDGVAVNEYLTGQPHDLFV